MRRVAEPSFATYRAHVAVRGANFLLTRSKSGRVDFGFNIGDSSLKPYGDFRGAYRASDRLVAIDTPQGWGTTSFPPLDPTWNGVDALIRFGFNGPPEPAAAAVSSPAPLAANASPPVIAVIHAIGVAYYNVYDGGPQACANGDTGHRVHLVARENPQAHPLTDAVIDLRRGGLCTLNFGFHQAGILSASGDMTLDLTDEGSYTVVDHERFDLTVHAFAIAFKHIVGDVTFSDLQFPASVDPRIFAKPTPAPSATPAHAR